MAVKKNRDYRLYVEDIAESIAKINLYVKNLSFERFSNDEKTIDAVVRNFEIIGEAASQLPKEFKAQYPEIEWRAIVDFRNVIIHEYFGIDIQIMWDIIQAELPVLFSGIKKILKS